MDIGAAVAAMQMGRRVRRNGWNGRGMWLAIIKETHLPMRNDIYDGLTVAPFVVMKTTDGTIVPWLCSQTDLLAGDWELAP